MDWEVRRPVPTSGYLEEYDARIVEREGAFRRRPRALTHIEDGTDPASDSAYLETLRKWIHINIREVRRRNEFIRCGLWLFFKENYHQDDDGDAHDVTVKVLTTLCREITRDVALYCQMISTGEAVGIFRDPQVARDLQCKYLTHFSNFELGMPLERADALRLLYLYQSETSLSQVIVSQLDQALEDITEVIRLATEVDGMPGPRDPSVRYLIRTSIFRSISKGRDEFVRKMDELEKKEISEKWATGIQFSVLMKRFPPMELPDLIKKQPRDYVKEIQESLEKDSNSGSNTLDGMVSHILNGVLDTPFVLRPDQLGFAKRLLDTPAQIRAYERWNVRVETLPSKMPWSEHLEDLVEEKEVLSSIVYSDAAKNVLLERILDLLFNSNKLVSVTTSIRNRICEKYLTDDKAFDAEYKNALEEYVGYFNQPQQQDPTFKELFAQEVDKEDRDADFGEFFKKGFY